jgi:hypothetical protein
LERLRLLQQSKTPGVSEEAKVLEKRLLSLSQK